MSQHRPARVQGSLDRTLRQAHRLVPRDGSIQSGLAPALTKRPGEQPISSHLFRPDNVMNNGARQENRLVPLGHYASHQLNLFGEHRVVARSVGADCLVIGDPALENRTANGHVSAHRKGRQTLPLRNIRRVDPIRPTVPLGVKRVGRRIGGPFREDPASEEDMGGPLPRSSAHFL